MRTTDGGAGGSGARLSPIYHRVYLVLRGRLAEGAYPPDAPLPGEHQLAEEFGASRVTIRRALDMLAQEGMISRQPGRGTFPLPPPPAAGGSGLGGLFENVARIGADSRVRLLEADRPGAPPQVAAALGLAPGAPVLKVVRVRWDGRGPFSHVATWVPGELAAGFTVADLETTPIVLLLERAGHAVASAEQRLSATIADPVLAPLLDVRIGSPLLVQARLVRGAGGRPIELSRWHYRPDRYEYALSMTRRGDGAGPRWVPADEPGAADAADLR